MYHGCLNTHILLILAVDQGVFDGNSSQRSLHNSILTAKQGHLHTVPNQCVQIMDTLAPCQCSWPACVSFEVGISKQNSSKNGRRIKKLVSCATCMHQTRCSEWQLFKHFILILKLETSHLVLVKALALRMPQLEEGKFAWGLQDVSPCHWNHVSSLWDCYELTHPILNMLAFFLHRSFLISSSGIPFSRPISLNLQQQGQRHEPMCRTLAASSLVVL